MTRPDRPREHPYRQWYEIVGVVGNVYDNGIERGPTAVVYWPTVVESFWGVDIFTRRMMLYAIRSSRVKICRQKKRISIYRAI